jgi:Flp pilus assembly protein TadG
MIRQRRHPRQRRRGAVLILVAIAMIPLLGMVALAVDYGYLLKEKTDLQGAADATALAAVLSLAPAPDGYQDLAAVRAAAREYAAANAGEGFTVLDEDIVIGRFVPSTIYTNLQIDSSGVLDTVRVTLRRDTNANGGVALFFAKVLGFRDRPISATATAALQKADGLIEGSDILPCAVPLVEWNGQSVGDVWSIYGDGRILDDWGNEIPGNWGTVDVGADSNSTNDLNDQILNGLRQSDLDDLYDKGTIPTNTHINSFYAMWLDADTGLSAGLKHSVYEVIGKQRLVPIYDTLLGESGDNMEAHIVSWGVVTITAAKFSGSKNTYIEITKSHMYDGDLRAHPDLSDELNVIENAFTSPVLLE